MGFQRSHLQWHLFFSFFFLLISLQKLMTVITLTSYLEGSATWRFGKLLFQVVPQCATAQWISWGDLPAGHSLLWVCTSGISLLLLQNIRAAVCSPSRSSTSYYIYLFSNKRIFFFNTHMHKYTYLWQGRVSVCMYAYFGFLVSKLSNMSSINMNNLLESSNINTTNECA